MSGHGPILSIIVPCYNEEEVLFLFFEQLLFHVQQFEPNFEVVLVDDGSTDGTLAVLKQLSQRDARFQYIGLSRNFGKEGAMYAGLQKAKGQYIAIMDADLQHPPSMLAQMYEGLTQQSYDCVACRRVSREGEPKLRSYFARKFYRLINTISKTEIVDGATDFRMMTRQMVESILSLSEYNRFSKGIFGWVGYRTKWLEYINIERAAGQTKWSFWQLFLYSLEGIVGFSTVPLAIATFIGFFFCLLAFAMMAFTIIKTILFGDPVAGYPTLISVILLIGGIQLFCVGILGQYLAKTYMEVKRRPIYIIKEESK